MESLLPEWAWTHLAPFVPSAGLAAVLGPATLAYAALAAVWVGRLRVGREVRAPYTRKIFHFVIFSAAGVVQLVWGVSGVVVFGTVVVATVLYAVSRGGGFSFYEALARPTDAPHRTLFILVPLATTAIGGVLSNLFFSPFAAVGYMVTGWGDAVGEPVGVRWGRHRYRVPSLAGVPATRSLEGSAAVFVVSTAAAALVLVAQGVDWTSAVGVGLLCGLAATGVEAVSTHGIDNLTVQVAASWVAHLLLSSL